MSVFAGVDVGSTKTCAIMAASRGQGPLELLGLGVARSEGMDGPRVADVEAATRSVRAAVSRAEAMAGSEVEVAYASLPGAVARTTRSKGAAKIPRRSAVAPAHIKSAQEVARQVALTAGHELLHALAEGYLIDGREEVHDPVGANGSKLEAEMCVVSAESEACREVLRAIDRAGYRAEELVLAPLATALAVLSDAERERGVALIEVGGATTDVLAYAGRRLAHAATLPWGGLAMTRDIALGLGIEHEEAEQLKHRFGSARRAAVDADESVEVTGGGSRRQVSRELLAHIIEQRLDEILGLVRGELEASGTLSELEGGIVLTGGGAALPHVESLARSVFSLPARVGVPGLGIAGMSESVALPSYATAVGVALYGASRAPKGATRTLARVGGWLKGLF